MLQEHEIECPGCKKVFDKGDISDSQAITCIKVYGCCKECYANWIDAKYPEHPDNKGRRVI